MTETFIIQEKRRLYLALGQSNMTDHTQAEILQLAANHGTRLSHCETIGHGGQALSRWMKDDGNGGFTPNELFAYDIFNFDNRALPVIGTDGSDGEISSKIREVADGWKGVEWEVVLFFMQGESDADTEPEYSSYKERFSAFLKAIKSYLGCARVRWCAGIPHRTDGLHPDGYQALNDALTELADTDPYGAAVATDDLPRVADNVHIDDDGSRELLAQRLWNGIPYN